MRKKNYIYCFLLLFLISLFVSCATTQPTIKSTDMYYVTASARQPTKEASIARAESLCIVEMGKVVTNTARIIVDDYPSQGNDDILEEQKNNFVREVSRNYSSMLSGLKRIDVKESDDGTVTVTMGIAKKDIHNGLIKIMDDCIVRTEPVSNEEIKNENAVTK